jgi:cytochrome c oxidase subunit III
MSYRPLKTDHMGHGPEEATSDLRTVDWWGVIFLIIVLAAFFSSIMFSWFYLRSAADAWPPIGTERPDVLLPTVATGALLASCLPLILLQLRLRGQKAPHFNIHLALSALLGFAFLVIQSVSFLQLDFGARDHAYGSALYTITIFVMLLVFSGLYVGAIVQARAWKGHFNGPRHVAITCLSTYWYAVTVKWMIVYASIYLLPLIE